MFFPFELCNDTSYHAVRRGEASSDDNMIIPKTPMKVKTELKIENDELQDAPMTAPHRPFPCFHLSSEHLTNRATDHPTILGAMNGHVLTRRSLGGTRSVASAFAHEPW